MMVKFRAVPPPLHPTIGKITHTRYGGGQKMKWSDWAVLIFVVGVLIAFASAVVGVVVVLIGGAL